MQIYLENSAYGHVEVIKTCYSFSLKCKKTGKPEHLLLDISQPVYGIQKKQR